MYYDLHIHSALSPCGDNTMTINNIFNMAYIKGIELIAICDHNSLKQQFYLDQIIESPVLKGKIDYIHGVELQSKEEIHVLAYFEKGTDLNVIQSWIEQHLKKKENNSEFYGQQYIFNELDEVIEEYNQFLIQSLDLNIHELIEGIHHFNGVAVLAHVMADKYGAYPILKDEILNVDYDGIEVTYMKELRDLKKLCPNIRDDLVLVNSDAHYLESINEPFYQLDFKQFKEIRQWKK